MAEIKEWGWAHNAAYNAMLQAGRALMFSRGYRPKSHERHMAVISFVEVVYSAKIPQDVIRAFRKARLRRNESLYGQAGTISETQGKKLVEMADIFVVKTRELLKFGDHAQSD